MSEHLLDVLNYLPEVPTYDGTDRQEGRPVITRAPDYLHPGARALVAEARALYGATSSRPMRDMALQTVPREVVPYYRLVYAAAGQPNDVPLTAGAPTLPYTDRIEGPKAADPVYPLGEALVLFSGGKDSVACALQVEREGYRPVLYFVAGINRGSSDELPYATAVARLCGWDLLVDTISVSGKKHGFTEQPTKNQVIMSLAAARIIDRGGPALLVGGWHTNEYQEGHEVDYDFSDGLDARNLYCDYLAARVPGLQHRTLLDGELHSLALVADAGLLQFVKGCMMPARYKKNIREGNQRKFGALMPGRCGSCVKCAWEEFALVALGVVQPRPDYNRHLERWLLEHYAHRVPTRDLFGVLGLLVPSEQAERLRRDAWPVQVDPASRGLLQPQDAATPYTGPLTHRTWP